jgi:hypothetical protein
MIDRQEKQARQYSPSIIVDIVFRNTFVITIANVLTSIFAGFVIFAYLGYLSYITGQNVDDVVSEGRNLSIARSVQSFQLS